MSTTFTNSTTFTLTHARHLASKVAADLRQCSTLYGQPLSSTIPDYMEELVELLVGGYVSKYEFGFKRNDQRVVCWRYVVTRDGTIDSVAGDAGKLYATARITGAHYYNHLSHTQAWFDLPADDRATIERRLPIRRSLASLPADGTGYWKETRGYGAAGVLITRKEFSPL